MIFTKKRLQNFGRLKFQVDDNDLPIHVAGCGTAEEFGRGRELVGCACAADGVEEADSIGQCFARVDVAWCL